MTETVCAETDLNITVAATKNSIVKYNALPDSAKEVPLSLKAIPSEINSRCVVGLMIIKNALKIGGINAKFNFIEMPNARRETDEVAKANAVISSHLLNETTLDVQGYKAKVYLSSAVMKHGEFQKGIYCLPENKKMLAVSNLQELREAGSALIGLHWGNDLKVLQNMGIPKIIKGPTTCSLFKMIKAGRADWVPLGFHNPPDMNVKRAGITLVPVPGIKISLIETRHFLLSKRHPQGKLIYEALEKGMAVMRKQGMMEKLLAQGGYTCPAARNWEILNKDEIKTKSN